MGQNVGQKNIEGGGSGGNVNKRRMLNKSDDNQNNNQIENENIDENDNENGNENDTGNSDTRKISEKNKRSADPGPNPVSNSGNKNDTADLVSTSQVSMLAAYCDKLLKVIMSTYFDSFLVLVVVVLVLTIVINY